MFTYTVFLRYPFTRTFFINEGGVRIISAKKPEQQRENLQHKEKKGNPGGGFKEAADHTQTGGFGRVTNSPGWKSTAFLLVIIIIVFLLYSIF